MPTIARVKWPEMNLNYGWLFKLSSLTDVMEYWEKVRSNRMRDGFSNLLKSREMAELVGVGRDAFQEHLSHSDGIAIYARCLTIDGSGLDAMSAVTRDLLSGMLKAIEQSGTIYVNNLGGYFTPGEDFEISDMREIQAWVLPGDTISVKKWPGGKHWYASIGGTSVVRNGESKWSTQSMAQLNAEKWAKENNVRIEEDE